MNQTAAKLLRSLLLYTAAFGIAAAPAAVAATAQATQAAPAAQTSPAAQTPCCGRITPNGYKLEALLDGMHVDQLWQPHIHIDWETGEPNRPADYTGPGRSSHCSAFAAAVGERLHIYMLRPPDHPQIFLASAQAQWFHSEEGKKDAWRPLTGPDRERQAQELANHGDLVVIVYESPDPHKPGHIVIVRPSEKSAAELQVQGPQITQAGAENYDNFIAAKAFKYHPGAWPNGVRYYWHQVDWASLNVGNTH